MKKKIVILLILVTSLLVGCKAEYIENEGWELTNLDLNSTSLVQNESLFTIDCSMPNISNFEIRVVYFNEQLDYNLLAFSEVCRRLQ